MSDLRISLIQSYQTGQFVETISGSLSPNRDGRRALTSELVALHNEQLVNVVEAFVGLRSKVKSGPEFFRLRHVFEEALPQLEAPVQEVVRCILQLYRDAGNDMVASTVLDAFREFCTRQGTRPQEALAEIEGNPDLLADLLIPTLIAGAHIDTSFYLDQAIRLCQHHNVEFRRRAFFALGRFVLGDDIARSESALSALEHAVETDMDGFVLASVIKSASALLRQDISNQHRYIAVIASALSRDNEQILHSASEVFGFQTRDLPPQLVQIFLHHLIQVKAANKGTLENIDYGISSLLDNHQEEVGIRFLEDLILSRPDDLALKDFDDTLRTIRDHAELRSKVLTRWLLRGSYPLCEGLDAIIELPGGDLLDLEVDERELVSSHPKHIQFVARKAIGFFFLKPIGAASFLISLMRHSKSDDVVEELGDLIFNPLLLNFSGSLRDYVARRAEGEVGCVKSALDQSLRSLEAYLEGLRSVGDIPPLQPSEEHREAHRRYFSQLMAESFKAAEAESSLLQFLPKSVLLYGNKAVYYAYGPEGKSSRMETPLLSHGAEIEMARMTTLDPQGLDFMLRVFRRERLTA